MIEGGREGCYELQSAQLQGTWWVTQGGKGNVGQVCLGVGLADTPFFYSQVLTYTPLGLRASTFLT